MLSRTIISSKASWERIRPLLLHAPKTERAPHIRTQPLRSQSLKGRRQEPCALFRSFSTNGPTLAETKVIAVPQMAESILEGVLASVYKRVGDYTTTLTITKVLVSEGDTVTVGQPVVEVSLESRDLIKGKYSEASKAKHKEEFNKSDLHQEPPKQVKMSRMRMRTAERLKESQNKATFLTTFNEVDMSSVMEFRKQNKDEVLRKHGVKLGFMGLISRASALALKEIPTINASIENDEMIMYRDYIDLIRNIENMKIVDVEKGIADLGTIARDGKLTMGDMAGGTFTISNSGIWGSLFGTPIINVPQTAVPGIYGIQERPVAVNGEAAIRPMMYTALTYDHRLVYGREAVTFLTLVKNHWEDPSNMLIV
ncbi:dihydrolipoamide succinyltransferase [Aspergillus affinis]|uniref:dihydrolipoamide succinyltransferase n=1 Tax=Aspergillus affinis TaxID=1070780 RepID=UPI0022FF391E|nr:dihydrolipoamide succinyltransferase [Aspergillus affinis]KAI9042444.1 dihydrolipoamide succinyltransferase [Aspergillus affinis]